MRLLLRVIWNNLRAEIWEFVPVLAMMSMSCGLVAYSYHTATHCNTLQHTATHCNTLQRTATHCNTLHHTTQYYNSTGDAERIVQTGCLQLTHCNAHCNTLQHTATRYNTLQQTATYCNSLQHIATHTATVLAMLSVSCGLVANS